MSRSKSTSGNLEQKVAGIDWNFNSWGGENAIQFFFYPYMTYCVFSILLNYYVIHCIVNIFRVLEYSYTMLIRSHGS